MKKRTAQLHYALHLGEENNSSQKGAVSPAIYNSSTFAYDTFEEIQKAFENERETPLYSRGCNPTVRLLEQKLAAIQGTEDALCFGSGSAAIAAAVVNCVQAGDHVLCIQSAYSWTKKLLTPLLEKFGVTHDFVDGKNTDHFLSHIKSNTRLIILESPSSLLMELQDVRSIAAEAKRRGIATLMDNSYASPLSQFPVDCGIDIIAHSATKYIAGHSDVVAGVLCGSNERMRSIFYEGYMTFGAVLNADAAWLILRSLRTLELRISASSKSTEAVFQFLKSHPNVAKVHWPFDPDNPQREMAEEQCEMPMPMLSIELKDADRVPAFCDALALFKLAVSWGSFESLAVPVQAFHGSNDLPQGLVRLYIGLEAPELLIDDLKQAIEA